MKTLLDSPLLVFALSLVTLWISTWIGSICRKRLLLWREEQREVLADAAPQPTAPVALAISGMNDVLNSEAYTQAQGWNRLPVEAWGLMAVISTFCNLSIGYNAYRVSTAFLVLPVAVSLSFLRIADIDSPRGGFIPVLPQNLVTLSQSLQAQ
jgi:hypothetical protein